MTHDTAYSYTYRDDAIENSGLMHLVLKFSRLEFDG
jgi:hypothetical protein